jgi:hypothetical protein
MKFWEFKIAADWEPRAESAETLGRRALKTIDALADASPHFTKWWFADNRVDIEPMIDAGIDAEAISKLLQERQVPLEAARNRMTEVVEYGVRKDDDGGPEPAGGYGISAFNYQASKAPPFGATFSAHGGGVVDPRAGLRYAQFETAVDPDPVIVSYPVFKAVLKSIVSAWEVRKAQAYSAALYELWNTPSMSFNLAWMTYLSPELARGFAPPGDVLVEYIDGGGVLMIAAEETFDTANPTHMAAARSIANALAGINADEEKTWQRLWPTRRPR